MNEQEQTQPEIRIVNEHITIPELKKIAEERFGDMVKGVVDVEQNIMALGGEMHADEEARLLEKIAHQTLANGRWQTFSLSEQLGNIGSEIERAIKWGGRGDIEHRAKALERSIELLDLTIADPRWKNNRLHELARVREVVRDTFFGDHTYGSSPESVARYFFPFAYAARLGRK